MAGSAGSGGSLGRAGSSSVGGSSAGHAGSGSGGRAGSVGSGGAQGGSAGTGGAGSGPYCCAYIDIKCIAADPARPVHFKITYSADKSAEYDKQGNLIYLYADGSKAGAEPPPLTGQLFQDNVQCGTTVKVLDRRYDYTVMPHKGDTMMGYLVEDAHFIPGKTYSADLEFTFPPYY